MSNEKRIKRYGVLLDSFSRSMTYALRREWENLPEVLRFNTQDVAFE
jgi:hypothetical protein